jgi:hypothetical protein
MAILARERPLEIATIKEGQPRNHGVFWITLPHWHHHPIQAEVWLRPDGTWWRVELRQRLRDCEVVVDHHQIDPDHAGTNDPSKARQVFEAWLKRYPAAIGDFMGETTRALAEARAYTRRLRLLMVFRRPGSYVDLRDPRPPACVLDYYRTKAGLRALYNRYLGRRGLRLWPTTHPKDIIGARRVPGSEALHSLAW